MPTFVEPQAPAAQTPPPIPPTILGGLNDRTIHFRVDGQPVDGNYAGSGLYVCIWKTPPAKGASLDCTQGSVQPTATKKNVAAAGVMPHVIADGSGQTDITLNDPLTPGEAVSIVQISTLVADHSNTKPLASDAYLVGTSEQCNHKPFQHPYSDCDMSFSIIGGVEQAGLSSQPSTTDGFLRVFTRAGKGRNQFWAEIRLLSAPQQSSSNGVVAAFTNPSGQITTTSVSNVGNSLDFSLGYERRLVPMSKYTMSLIAGGGGTTPLASNSVSEAFTAPPLGTVECITLYDRFKSYFADKSYNILQNSATNDMGTPPSAGKASGACLLNGNSPTTTNGTTTYAPINTVGFSNQDRSAFFGKYFAGFRSIYRFKAPNAIACGDTDAANHIAPCSRGIVDFTVGQDESVSGGRLHGVVFKVEGVQPLPIKGNAFLYIFGSFSMRTSKNQNLPPLILQTATLPATGATAVPNVNTVVLPLQQPDRDFYRFGVGVDAVCIFTKIFASSPNCPSSGSTTQ